MNFPKISGKWGNDGFTVRDKRVIIRNGKAFHNLPLHCSGSRTLMLAGSKPMLLMFNSNVLPLKHVKFGDWAMKVAFPGSRAKWLHDFNSIVTTYDAGRAHYLARDAAMPGLTVHLEFVPLVSADGLLIRLVIGGKNCGKGTIKIA